MGEISRSGATRFPGGNLALAAGFSVLIAIVSATLHFPIKIPGHSALLWISLLVAARGIVGRAGAASAIGVASGVLVYLAGAADKGLLDSVAIHGAAGLGVDLVAWNGALELVGRCAFAGLAGNLAKLAAKILLEMLVGIPAGIFARGLGFTFVVHVLFGLGAGYLGHLLLRLWRRRSGDGLSLTRHRPPPYRHRL